MFENNCTKNTKTNKRLDEKRVKELNEQKIRNQRELNPYFQTHGQQNPNQIPEQKIVGEPTLKQTNPSIASTVSLTERNSLNAKLLKAELMGNQTLVQQIKDKLKQLESKQSLVYELNEQKDKEKTFSYENRFSEENMSLKEMFFREKQSTVEDETKRYVATTSRTGPQEEYEDLFRKNKKRRHEANSSGIRNIRHEDEDRFKCRQCFDNIDKQLILSNGEKTLISLTPFQPFVNTF